MTVTIDQTLAHLRRRELHQRRRVQARARRLRSQVADGVVDLVRLEEAPDSLVRRVQKEGVRLGELQRRAKRLRPELARDLGGIEAWVEELAAADEE